MSRQSDHTIDRQEHISGIAARLFWMLFGNAVLVFSIGAIVQHKEGPFCTADVVFWLTVPALVLVRHLDIKVLGGLTAGGMPASMAHWRRYAVLLLICSATAWVLSHAVNYLFVNK